jgi:hypothetical protein
MAPNVSNVALLAANWQVNYLVCTSSRQGSLSSFLVNHTPVPQENSAAWNEDRSPYSIFLQLHHVLLVHSE